MAAVNKTVCVRAPCRLRCAWACPQPPKLSWPKDIVSARGLPNYAIFFVNLLSDERLSRNYQWPRHGNGGTLDNATPSVRQLCCSRHIRLGCNLRSLAASTGERLTPQEYAEPSHVLSAMGLNEKEANSSVRFSFGRFTIKEQVREAVNYSLEGPRNLG